MAQLSELSLYQRPAARAMCLVLSTVLASGCVGQPTPGSTTIDDQSTGQSVASSPEPAASSGPTDEQIIRARTDQLGICAEGSSEPAQNGRATACWDVVADGREVRVAVIDADPSRPATLFYGGGPGADLTRLAGFIPRAEIPGDDPLILVGEPGSILEPSSDCRASLTSLTEGILANRTTDDNMTPCQTFFEQVSWSEPLIAEVIENLVTRGYTVDRVIAYSFGSRLHEAFLAVDQSRSIGLLSQVTITQAAAPAPAGAVTGKQVIEFRRQRFTSVMNEENLDWCAPDRGCDLDPRWAISSIAAAYSLEENRPVMSELARGVPDRLSDRDALVRGLLLLDGTGKPTPQLGRFLAIECGAYRGWPDEPADNDPLSLIFQSCGDVARMVPEMPSLTDLTGQSKHNQTVCVLYSRSDPVTGRPESESVAATIGDGRVVEVDIQAGHHPRLLISTACP